MGSVPVVLVQPDRQLLAGGADRLPYRSPPMDACDPVLPDIGCCDLDHTRRLRGGTASPQHLQDRRRKPIVHLDGSFYLTDFLDQLIPLWTSRSFQPRCYPGLFGLELIDKGVRFRSTTLLHCNPPAYGS